MDRREQQRRAAVRAEEAMAAAVAAANARAPVPGVVEGAMAAVRLVCWDESLEPRERLLLIDDALALLNALKDLPAAPPAARPDLVLALLRGTNGLLQRYAAFIRIRK